MGDALKFAERATHVFQLKRPRGRGLRLAGGVFMAGCFLAGLVAGPTSWLTQPAFAAGSPAQPKTGPGGSDYAISVQDIGKVSFGEGNGRALAFFPKGHAATPRPVVVFVHAPGAISPSFYGAWLSHLVRRGNVVIYPLYEASVGAVPFDEMTGEALKGVRAALTGLATNPDARPDLQALSIIGHSGGAVIAANLAALSGKDELPSVRLLFGAMPARPGADKIYGPPLHDISTMPAKTLALMLIGDRDPIGADRGARQILTAAGHLGRDHRLIARAGSDNHGLPPVVYSHHAAIAPDEAWDLAQMPGGGPEAGAAPVAAPGQPAPKLSAQELRAQREGQRKRTAALWRVGHEERRSLMSFEGRSVGSANYAIWKLFDLAEETVLANGDAMTLKRDSRLYDMGLWNDGWPLRRLSVETPKPVTPKEGPAVSQSESAPASRRAP